MVRTRTSSGLSRNGNLDESQQNSSHASSLSQKDSWFHAQQIQRVLAITFLVLPTYLFAPRRPGTSSKKGQKWSSIHSKALSGDSRRWNLPDKEAG